MKPRQDEEDLIYLMRNARSVATQLSSEAQGETERPVSMRAALVASIALFCVVAVFTWYPEFQADARPSADGVSSAAVQLDWSHYPLPEGHPFELRLAASKKLVQGLYETDLTPPLRHEIRVDLEQWPLEQIAEASASRQLLIHLVQLCRLSGDDAHRPFLEVMCDFDDVAIPIYAERALTSLNARLASGATGTRSIGGAADGMTVDRAEQSP